MYRPAPRPRIVCDHDEPACYVSLRDAEGAQVVRPLWITNYDVVQQFRTGRNTPGDRLAFITADGCHIP